MSSLFTPKTGKVAITNRWNVRNRLKHCSICKKIVNDLVTEVVRRREIRNNLENESNTTHDENEHSLSDSISTEPSLSLSSSPPIESSPIADHSITQPSFVTNLHIDNGLQPKRDEYSLFNYFVHPKVLCRTRHLIRSIPAFIVPTPQEECKYYIIPNTFEQSSSAIINATKYCKRSQEILLKAQKENNASSLNPSKSETSQHEESKKAFKKPGTRIRAWI